VTRDAFDDEGFYKIGDALKFADPDDAAKGLLFDGRLAEDFKLSTGTWVSVGSLRARLIEHFAPYVWDAVIAGADRGEIAALVFPEIDACRGLCADLSADMKPSAIFADSRLRLRFASLLGSLAKLSSGSSTLVCRLLLLEHRPSMDAGEMTDKGSINQRVFLANRAALVAELYAAPDSPRVIAIPRR
jgi:feruloyl-CoA synthase